jgi:hypothetical protein
MKKIVPRIDGHGKWSWTTKSLLKRVILFALAVRGLFHASFEGILIAEG